MTCKRWQGGFVAIYFLKIIEIKNSRISIKYKKHCFDYNKYNNRQCWRTWMKTIADKDYNNWGLAN